MMEAEGLPAGWEIIAKAGSGSFTNIYAAKNRRGARLAIIKEFAASDFHRFRREAQILTAIHHPNIVRLLDHGQNHEKAWLIFAHEDGETLEQTLAKSPERFDEAAVIRLLACLLGALQHLHEAGFLHRDLKPSNILIRPGERPLLLDFGAALPIGDQSEDSRCFSELTPGYAALEQYRKDGGEGPWTDVYALGAVFYRIIASAKPMPSPDRAKGPDQAKAADAGLEKYSKGLLRTIDWALKLDRRERLSSVAQWQKELTHMVMAASKNKMHDDVSPTVRIRRIGGGELAPAAANQRLPLAAAASEAPVKINYWRISSRLIVAAALVAGIAHLWPILIGWSKAEWIIDAQGKGDARTIGEAIALARDGAVIRINPGTYPEALTVVNPLHLVGAGETSQEAVIAPAAGSCLLVSANSGSISKLSLISAANDLAPCLDMAGGVFRIENTRIIGGAGPAVQIRNGADPIIRGNRVLSAKGPGLLIKDEARGAITDNIISLTGFPGVIVQGAAKPLVASNRIDHAGQAGILVSGGGRFLDNVISESGKSGVEVRNGGDPVFVGNRIEASKEAGIYVHGGGRGLFGRNSITGNGYSGVVVGQGGDPLMSENSIGANKEHGVLVLDGGKGGFKKNYVEKNNAHGFAVGLESDAQIDGNRAIGNRDPQILKAKAPNAK